MKVEIRVVLQGLKLASRQGMRKLSVQRRRGHVARKHGLVPEVGLLQ